MGNATTWPLKHLYAWEDAHGISSQKARNANGHCSPGSGRETLTAIDVWLLILLFALGYFIHCLDED